MLTLPLRLPEMRRIRLVSDSTGRIHGEALVARLVMPCLTLNSIRRLTDLCLCIRVGIELIGRGGGGIELLSVAKCATSVVSGELGEVFGGDCLVSVDVSSE